MDSRSLEPDWIYAEDETEQTDEQADETSLLATAPDCYGPDPDEGGES